MKYETIGGKEKDTLDHRVRVGELKMYDKFYLLGGSILYEVYTGYYRGKIGCRNLKTGARKDFDQFTIVTKK